jgi:N-acyl-L-homoserine lactone synthetase
MSVIALPSTETGRAPARRPQPRPVLFDYISPARKVSTESDLDRVYRLRYRVFCQELGLFNPADYPDGRERDEHDGTSVHFAGEDTSGVLAGTVRLVLCRPFPLESRCRFFADAPRLDELRVAEISRLAVRRDVSARRPIVVALYKAMILESRRLGLTHWVAAMEKPLCRVLRGLGCDFTPIGPEVDYSGPVRPYLGAIDRLWREQRLTYLD